MGQKYSFSYYFYVQKGKTENDQNNIGLYILNNYGAEINQRIKEVFDSLDCEDMKVESEINFARHNGLYEYTDCTLPLWTNMYVEEKI